LPAQFGASSSCTTKNSVIVGSTYYGVYASTDDGNNWVYHGTPMRDVAILAAKDSLVFALGDGRLYRSAINDTTWTNIAQFSNSVNAIVLIDSELIIGTSGGVFVSFDDGNTWSNESAGLTNPSITSLGVINSELVGGLYRPDPSTPGMWRRPISELAQPDAVLAASADTIDFGHIAVGKDSLRVVTVTNVGKLPLTISSFQLTQSPNAFITSDLSSEVQLNPGEHFTFEVLFTPTKSGAFSAYITIASEAKTINIVLIGTANGVDEVGPQSQLHSMITVAPNPFSQSTQITFTSQTAGYAEVSIVNMLGVEVAHLFSGELGAGEHSFMWGNSTGLTEGVYECLVRMNGQAETLPVVKF
jgi:hypothetical protein